MAARGISVTYETVRQWCRKFGPEYAMRGFKATGHAQRFLSVHGVVQNLLRVGRHLQRATTYRLLCDRSFKEWSAATAA